ncbi:hypothetical protein [Thalassobaculum sp.]|uniref:hypothetical protein n=1 Tax=Thalassobaculum sp. TaxID=2022740 RepID=UPI0032ECF54B
MIGAAHMRSRYTLPLSRRHPWDSTSFALAGGLDLVSPAIRTPPGRMIAGVNYEPDVGGYARVYGNERTDGRPAPSAASYWTIDFDQGQTQIMAEDVVTGATSGATGIALYNVAAVTGSYGGSDATGTIVLTQVNGTFQDNENLQVSASTVVVADGVATERGASNDTDDTTWLRAAVAYARTQIAAVPGSGPVRGVWLFNGDRYAFRDNVGATAGVMHKATTSGWVAQSFGRSVAFTSGGTTPIAEQDTITGATSAATATVERVIVSSGSWAAGDAVGRLILSGQTGTFQSENLDVGASLNLATIGGDSAAITLPAGGRYDFANHNFYGDPARFRMYFANGVGTAHDWDGTVLVPIVTGETTDTPSRVAAHKEHLWLVFPGGGLKNSSIGEPYDYIVATGSGTHYFGQEITDLLADVLGIMVVFGRSRVSVLSGNDINDFRLDPLADDAGAMAHTAQRIGRPLYIDDAGVRDMTATQRFGDFNMGSVSQAIHPYFKKKIDDGVFPVATLRCRNRGQYRVYYADGTGVTIYFGRQYPESGIFDLGISVACACSGEDANGVEVMLLGDEDGMVYQLDKGTSFDGEEVLAFCRLAFNNIGSPDANKRFHKAVVELDADAATVLALTAEYSYADPDQAPAQEQTFTVRGGGGFWDEMQWDQFIWSAPVKGEASARIDGQGRNISITVISASTYERAHTLHGVRLLDTKRKQSR